MQTFLTKNDTLVLKGVAILAMLMHHVFSPFAGTGFFIDQLQGMGKVCVALFVLLSGYGLSVGYQRITPPSIALREGCQNPGFGELATLVIRRLVKFYLNYWAVFFVAVPIGVFLFGRPIDAGYEEGTNVIKHFVWDILGVNGTGSYNATWWFNKLILTLYLISPVVFVFLQKYPLGTLIAIFLMQRFKLFGGNLNVYLMAFALGFVWAQETGLIHKVVSRIPRWLGPVIAWVLLFVTMCLRQQGLVLAPTEWDTYLALAIAVCVVWSNPRVAVLDKALGFLGKHSMNIYLTHTFISYYFCREALYTIQSPWLVLLIVLAASLVLSLLLEGLKTITGVYKLQNAVLRRFSPPISNS